MINIFSVVSHLIRVSSVCFFLWSWPLSEGTARSDVSLSWIPQTVKFHVQYCSPALHAHAEDEVSKLVLFGLRTFEQKSLKQDVMFLLPPLLSERVEKTTCAVVQPGHWKLQILVTGDARGVNESLNGNSKW